MFDIGELWRRVMARLGDLPDDDRDEVVASLMSGAVTDGEVALVLAQFLAGRGPGPELSEPALAELLLGTLDDQETDRCTAQADALRVDPGPGPAAALAELAATAGPGGDLPAGWSDEQVLAFVQAAEQQARWAHALRGVGLRELAARWTTRNPTHDTDTGTGTGMDAERQRRLRTIEKREERTNPVRRAATGPRTPTPAQAMAAEVEAQDRGLTTAPDRRRRHPPPY